MWFSDREPELRETLPSDYKNNQLSITLRYIGIDKRNKNLAVPSVCNKIRQLGRYNEWRA